MARPQTKPYGELILPVFTQWEKVGSLTGILRSLEEGDFYDASLLVDQMLRDDRIKATWNVRMQALFGMPMHIETGKDTKKAQRILDEAEAAWPKMAPRSELMTLMTYGLFLGACVARKTWVRTDNEWMPKLRTWHPGALRFDRTTDRYMLRTQDAGEIPIEPGDPNWLLFTPYGHKYGRLQGLIRSAAMVYLCRQWAFRDRARHSERHGLPFLQLVVPAEADQRQKQEAIRLSRALGTETVAVTPQDVNGKGFDVKLIEAQADSHKVFGAQIDHLDDATAILFLGQAMSTKGQSGLGSQDKAGDTVRRDIMRFDAGSYGDIGEEVLGDWSDFNKGRRDLELRPIVEVEPPEDGVKKAQELSTLGDALDKLAKYGVDVEEVLKSTGLPMKTKPAAAPTAVEADPAVETAPVDPAAAADGGQPVADANAASATLAFTSTDLASIVKVDEGRKSVGLDPVGGEIGGKWVRQHAAELTAELPGGDMPGAPGAPQKPPTLGDEEDLPEDEEAAG